MENLGAFMLTFLEIKKAQAKDKEYNLADGNGLYLRILPSGIKNWIANFRSDGKKISKKLGSFPELSIKEAREKLSLLKAQAKFEGSPVIKEKVHTFEEIYYEWIEVKKVKVKNWQDISNRIERYILPSLGKIDYKAITPVAFVEILKQDLYTRGKYETIKRICMYIKEIDIYAMNIGYVKELRFQNLYSVFPVKTVIKNRPSVHYSQLPTVLEAQAIDHVVHYHKLFRPDILKACKELRDIKAQAMKLVLALDNIPDARLYESAVATDISVSKLERFQLTYPKKSA